MSLGYNVGLGIFVIMLVVATVAVAVKSKDKKHDKVRKSILWVFAVAIITCSANMSAVSTPFYTVANVAYSVYFASIDWLLLALLMYSIFYTKVWDRDFSAPFLIAFLATIDTISLLLNVIFGHNFTITEIQTERGIRYLADCHELWLMHLSFSYIVVVLIVIIFIRKIVITAGYHRMKYIMVLVLVLMVVITNAMFLALKMSVDVSLYLYVFAALGVAYFSLYYSPKNFVEYMLINVTDKMNSALMCFDDNNECVYYNELAMQIYGKDNTKEIIEERVNVWRKGQPLDLIRDSCWSEKFEIDGVVRHFDINYVKVLDNKNHYCGSYALMRDISSEIQAFEDEKYRANHDSLTGALNREAFYNEARVLFRSNPDVEFAIICSNIKDFKIINDVFGLDVGDKILIRIANMIRANLEDSACFARLEADRFALIMPKARYNEAVFFKCMDEIAAIVDNSLYRMCIQMGVYFVEDKSLAVATMCDRAYLAIKSIKDNYTERIAYYGDTLRHSYMNEQKIIGEFGNAIETEQFKMYLQPIVDANTGEVHLAEALVRWIHPKDGLYPPAKFIGILEDTGDIYKLDMYMWEQACKTIAKWRDMGINDVNISVNISVKDFFYIDVLETLKGLIEKYCISPSNINLEITESAFMTDSKKQVERINQMKDYGFKVEIDDFGSGYSSLNMLKEMSADILKIDMNFLSFTDNEARSFKILNSVVGLAKSLNMDVITEGVELEEQVNQLKKMGSDMFQGYYFSKPMPLEDFEEKYFK
ncbi:MAG: bifunctional diguanylate cyclase/phosphodiesterase [Pseudobutyrivibrio sp.]|nr:bifunctional diguanylate cyclase/phosphodiesterase [Pseudobutyrivibrio sp.]